MICFSCSENGVNQTSDGNNEIEFISAVDISSYPKIELSNPIFKDNNGISASLGASIIKKDCLKKTVYKK